MSGCCFNMKDERVDEKLKTCQKKPKFSIVNGGIKQISVVKRISNYQLLDASFDKNVYKMSMYPIKRKNIYPLINIYKILFLSEFLPNVSN